MKKLVVSLAMAACLVGSADAKCYKWWKYKNCVENASNLHYGLTQCAEQATIDTCGKAGCDTFRRSVSVSVNEKGEPVVFAKADAEATQYLGGLAADGEKLGNIHAKCAPYYPQVGAPNVQQLPQAQLELKPTPSSGSSRGMGRGAVAQPTLPQSSAPTSAMGRTITTVN